MMTTRRVVLALAVLSPCGAVTFADDAALVQCARIASPLDRLECYDALAATLETKPEPAPARAAASDGARKAPAVTAQATEPAQKPAAAAPVAEFGFESRRIEETPDEVTAHYDGEFTGWSGQTLFKLDNGQVWKQAQSGRVSFRKSNPVVTIRKGAFGSFRLSVEGLNKTIRVKRIK